MQTPQELKIVSWNMWVMNSHLDDAFEFIRTLDFDVLCLQEVPQVFLPRLRALPYQIAIGQDSVWLTDTSHPEKGESKDFLVIMSKHPVRETYAFALPTPKQNWRVLFARSLMKLLMPTRVAPIYGREILAADIDLNDQGNENSQSEKTIRVFSIHLPLLSPAIRHAEFKIVREHLSANASNIVCGDFNIIDFWLLKPLNFLQGGRFVEMLPWYNERAHIEKEFAAAKFANPLAGLVTQKISHSQLDHILVPEIAEVLEQKVISETAGSDHNPIFVKLRL